MSNSVWNRIKEDISLLCEDLVEIRGLLRYKFVAGFCGVVGGRRIEKRLFEIG